MKNMKLTLLFCLTIILFFGCAPGGGGGGGGSSSGGGDATGDSSSSNGVTNLTAAVTANSVSLSWTRPETTFNLIGYRITGTADGAADVSDTVACPYADDNATGTSDYNCPETGSHSQSDLDYETEYTFSVLATYYDGTDYTTGSSTSVTVTTESAEDDPTNVTDLTATATGSTVSLSWTRPETDSNLTGYSIARTKDGATDVTSTVACPYGYDYSVYDYRYLCPATESHSQSGLDYETEYRFIVYSTYSTGNSPGVPVTATTPAYTVESGSYNITGHSLTTGAPSYVNIMFQVTNTDGDSVSTLTTEDFNVLEDSSTVSTSESAKRIRKQEEIPYKLRVVLMLDNSSSINSSELAEIKDAANELINIADATDDSSRDGDTENQYFLIYSFDGSQTKLTPTWTNNVSDLQDAIDSISLGGSSTDLYGSVITGVGNWTDSYSTSEIIQGFLVLLTDGEDTSGLNTIDQATTSRGSKKVITIGVGDDADTAALTTLGNHKYYPISDASDLSDEFTEIQTEMTNFANSFYWLDFISPKRGYNTHTLALSIVDNINTADTATYSGDFDSDQFYSVNREIYINDGYSDTDGIDSVAMDASATFQLNLHTYFGAEGGEPLTSQFSVDKDCTDSVVTIDDASSDTGVFVLTATGSSGNTCTLTAEDTANGYEKDLSFSIN